MWKPHYRTPAVRMRIAPWQRLPHVIHALYTDYAYDPENEKATLPHHACG